MGGSLGALIGLERQWDEQFHHVRTRVLAGLRTFTLWAVFGVLCAWFAQTVNALFYLTGFVAMAIWLTLFLWGGRRERGGPPFTTGAAGMITFLIGGLVFWGEEKVALVLAVSMIILLAVKPVLHRFSQGITIEDVRTALKFAAVTGVVLPLVPDEALGSYGAFNPHTIWMMVVLVSGVGFVGYLAVRFFGQHNGIAITGLLGGLASSTATTLAMSRQSKERPAESRDCSMAILLACTIMSWRVGLLVGIVNLGVLVASWPALVVVSLPSGIWCLWRLFHGGSGAGEARDVSHYGNPLRLRAAFQFGALYAVIVFAVKATLFHTGESGLLVVSSLSGFVDLDAITLSLTQMTGSASITAVTATQGILLAILSNTVIKAVITAIFGAPDLRREVVIVLGVTSLVLACLPLPCRPLMASAGSVIESNSFSTRRASAGVSTPMPRWVVWITRMGMPCSRARSCSSFSQCSRGDGGNLTIFLMMSRR